MLREATPRLCAFNCDGDALLAKLWLRGDRVASAAHRSASPKELAKIPNYRTLSSRRTSCSST